MKVGIVIHSFTGNTYSVGEAIKSELEKENHIVDLKRMDIIGGEVRDEINISRINFTEIINPDNYDVLIFGGPVRGFSISPALKSYLVSLQKLKNKPVFIFVTHYFPLKSMGGTSAIKQIKMVCNTHGANIIGTGIIDWKTRRRSSQIQKISEEIKKAIEKIKK